MTVGILVDYLESQGDVGIMGDVPQRLLLTDVQRLLEKMFDKIRIVGLTTLRPETPRTILTRGHQAEETVLLAFHAHWELETLVDVLAGGLLVLSKIEELLEASCDNLAVPVKEQSASLAGILVPTLVFESVTAEIASVYVVLALDWTDVYVIGISHEFEQVPSIRGEVGKPVIGLMCALFQPLQVTVESPLPTISERRHIQLDDTGQITSLCWHGGITELGIVGNTGLVVPQQSHVHQCEVSGRSHMVGSVNLPYMDVNPTAFMVKVFMPSLILGAQIFLRHTVVFRTGLVAFQQNVQRRVECESLNMRLVADGNLHLVHAETRVGMLGVADDVHTFGEQVADDGMRLTDENPVQLWIHGLMPCLTASRHHFTQTVQADDYRIRIDMLPRPSALSRAGQSSKNSQSGHCILFFRSVWLSYLT